MKKILALVLALVMVLAVAAASASTITITPPTGTDANAENTYNIYKIFDAVVNADDATKVSYKLLDGIDEAPAGFTADTARNVSYTGSGNGTDLTPEDIEAIKQYIADNNIPVAHDAVTVKGTATASFGDLDAGYYFIDTTTGTLVSIKTNNEALNLADKNSVPSLDKRITNASGTVSIDDVDTTNFDEAGLKAIAEVGTNVEFTVPITVGKGMLDYVLHDKMSTGLSLNADSVSISYSAKPDDYTDATIKTGTDADEGDDLTIEFADGLAEGTVITVTYTAKVTNEALTITPEKNTAKVEYGNGPKTGFTPPKQTETYSAKIGVLKLDGTNGDAPLPGAGFKLYKLDGTTKLYYAYNATSKTVSWGAEDDGDERITGNDGTIDPFLGLNDGTYYLKESTVPDGYNAPESDTEVIILGDDYTANNLEQVKTVRNNQGTVLPSTGGIGTTIFYIVGGLLVIGAAVILVARRKSHD